MHAQGRQECGQQNVLEGVEAFPAPNQYRGERQLCRDTLQGENEIINHVDWNS